MLSEIILYFFDERIEEKVAVSEKNISWLNVQAAPPNFDRLSATSKALAVNCWSYYKEYVPDLHKCSEK